MTTFNHLTASVAQIDKAIESIRGRGARIDSDIQAVGLACLVQIKNHGNVTPLNTLYKALPNGMRSTAFALWAVKFGGVEINQDSKARKAVPLAYVSADAVNLEEAAAQSWHKVKTEPTLAQCIDVEKAVDGLLRRLAKAPSVSNPELVKRLVELRKGTTKRAENAPVLPALPTQIQ